VDSRGGRRAILLNEATPATPPPAALPSGPRRVRHADTSHSSASSFPRSLDAVSRFRHCGAVENEVERTSRSETHSEPRGCWTNRSFARGASTTRSRGLARYTGARTADTRLPLPSRLPCRALLTRQISFLPNARSGDGEAYAALRRRKDWNEKLRNLESLDYEVIDNRW